MYLIFKSAKQSFSVSQVSPLTCIIAPIALRFCECNFYFICFRQDGAKYRQAREWGKPVVNAHWLFEVMFCSYNCICRPEQRRFQHFSLMNPFCINCDAVPHLMGKVSFPSFVPSILNPGFPANPFQTFNFRSMDKSCTSDTGSLRKG